MPPLKGAVVLGIDPGFLNGCKLAVITPAGEVMDTGVIYPKFSGKENLILKLNFTSSYLNYREHFLSCCRRVGFTCQEMQS